MTTSNLQRLWDHILTPRLFQQALDLLDQGIVCFGADGQLLCFNRRYTELLELPAEFMLQLPDKRAIVAFQRARGDFEPPGRFFDARGLTVRPDPTTDEMPGHYWRRTGSGKTLEVTIAALSSGLHVRTFTDVTPYFDAQREVQRGAARLKRVMDAMNPGIWETDLITGVVEINDAWAQLLGYERSALEPMTRERWRSMIHPEDLEATGHARAAFMTGLDRQFDSRFRMRHRDGHWIWMRCTGKNYQGLEQEGALIISGTLVDISEKMDVLERTEERADRLQDTVQTQTRQLERALTDMTMISSSLAHDLRTPLRSINGYASILAEGVLPLRAEQVQAYTHKIAEHSATMGQMITRMLDLLQVLQAHPTMKPMRVSQIARARMQQLTQSGADIDFTCAETPEVLADPDLVDAALEQLLRNALTHGRQQARQKIALGYDQQERVYFVRDEGAGFDMAMAERLFKPFSTLDRQGPSTGRGMGLAIASRCIERVGGRLWASSTPGGGSTFYFTLG